MTYIRPWWEAFVYPAVISHHSRKNRWAAPPELRPPLYGTVVLVTYVITSNRVIVFERLEIKGSIAIFSATALNLKFSASLFDWETWEELKILRLCLRSKLNIFISIYEWFLRFYSKKRQITACRRKKKEDHLNYFSGRKICVTVWIYFLLKKRS